MKVKDLIRLLNEVPQELPVYIAGDSEGNSFSELSDFEQGHYREDTYYGGVEIVHSDDVEEDDKNCIVFWPN